MQAHMQRVHYNEPRVCWEIRTAGQLEGTVQDSRHDGARLRSDLRDHAVLQWVSNCLLHTPF